MSKSGLLKAARTLSCWCRTRSGSTHDTRPGEVFSVDILDERDGTVILQVAGKGVEDALKYESGGHRWQRIPPTEKRGRYQTSTITVAVLPEPTDRDFPVSDRDVEINYIRGSGKGGQARNKTSNCVQMTHKASGLAVRVESERSQFQNKQAAFALLRARLKERADAASGSARAAERKSLVGVGARGDKRRSIRVQDNSVVDHVTGGRMRADRYLKGYVDELWD